MKRIPALTLALSMGLVLITSEALAAGPAFKPGDRVECDTVGNKAGFRKATVVPFLPGDVYNSYDAASGYFVRVEIDGWGRDSTIPCVVWPIRIAFTNKEHYRTSTTVWEGRIRIFNFFVNSFGEWQYGLAESVKRAETRIIQK